VAADGRSGDVLFALGALSRGTLWESTAIPEIRAQAERLASVLRLAPDPLDATAARALAR
jgi:uncharacterized NAD(P)/FAD-binding protein YdhS